MISHDSSVVASSLLLCFTILALEWAALKGWITYGEFSLGVAIASAIIMFFGDPTK